MYGLFKTSMEEPQTMHVTDQAGALTCMSHTPTSSWAHIDGAGLASRHSPPCVLVGHSERSRSAIRHNFRFRSEVDVDSVIRMFGLVASDQVM